MQYVCYGQTSGLTWRVRVKVKVICDVKVIGNVKVKGQGHRTMTVICIYIVNNSVFAVPLVFCPTSVTPNSNLAPFSDIIALAFPVVDPSS